MNNEIIERTAGFMKTELMKLDCYITFCLRLKNQVDNSGLRTNI